MATRSFNQRYPSIKWFLLVALILTIPLTVFSVQKVSTTTQQHAATVYDLKSYYPDLNMFNNYYLVGSNYATTPASAAVLWFRPQDQWTFYQYNSNPASPTSTCHYSQLSWWDDGFLRYVKTHDQCGSPANDIVYSPPIIYLPRYWNSTTGSWSLSGSSNAAYYLNNSSTPSCTGVINYTSKIIGLEQIAPGGWGIHWQSKSTTNWTTGALTGQCYAGYKTNWLEDYWLYANLPINRSTTTLPINRSTTTAPAIKRSKGGNVNITSGNWDISFNHWQLLPWVTPTPIP